MKKTLLALIPLAASLLLASCGNPGSNEEPPVESSSSETVQEEPLDDLSDVEYDLSISINGHLNDFLVGVPAIAGESFLLDFGFSIADESTAVVKTDRPAVASPRKQGDAWYLDARKAGLTHLIIEDGDGVIHLRMVLEVKAPLKDEDILANLSSVDHWEIQKGWEMIFGNFTVTFFEDGTAAMAGRESGGVNLSGATFRVELDNSILDGSVYDPAIWTGFAVKNWTVGDFNLSSVIVYKSGDLMHMRTNNALLGMLVPGEAR
ncbi:MAG: hypothetical protein ACI4UT_03900 [Candidatus Enteromonas sp.]